MLNPAYLTGNQDSSIGIKAVVDRASAVVASPEPTLLETVAHQLDHMRGSAARISILHAYEAGFDDALRAPRLLVLLRLCLSAAPVDSKFDNMNMIQSQLICV